MNALIIEATVQTPYICFDPTDNKFEIKGKSLPEDSDEFYEPVIKWFENYREQPAEQTDFHFMLDYFNTSTSRYVSAMINILDIMSEKHKVKIFWHYREIDEDMLSMGEEYYDSTNVEFELVEVT